MLRPRDVLVVCFGLSLCVGLFAVLSKNGWWMLRAQQRENAQLSQQVQAQRDRNDTLKDAVATLNAAGVDGQAALERAARNELGFVRTDEILLTGLPVAAVRSDVSADAPADASAAPVAAVSPPPKK